MTELTTDTPDLTPRPTQLSIPVSAERDHVLGDPRAAVMLLEYGDYECPDCGRAYPLLEALKERFSDRLAFAFRHFPLFTIHTHASIAAQAAEAAGAQGKFWEMHDLLYQNQHHIDTPDLTHYALRAGLEVYRFEQALSGGVFAPRIEADFAGGKASGVRGTPTLFLNGERYSGPVESAALEAAINAASRSTRNLV